MSRLPNDQLESGVQPRSFDLLVLLLPMGCVLAWSSRRGFVALGYGSGPYRLCLEVCLEAPLGSYIDLFSSGTKES